MGLSTGHVIVEIVPPGADENAYPQGRITAPTMAQQGSPVAFSSSGSFDPDGSIVSYSWDFGDGTSSTATNPTKTFFLQGFHAVILTVTDNNGAAGTATHTIFITPDAVTTIDPTGTFSINGVEATDTSEHSLTSRVLDLKFVASRDAEEISKVRVGVYQDGREIAAEKLEKTNANTWKKTYTLPMDGTFELRGTVSWGLEGDSKRLMSVITSYSESGPPLGESGLPIGNILRVAMGLLVVVGLYNDHKNRKT